ncbi:uracil-DNA glycosylase [Rhodocaloribacter sp.]
MLLEPVWQRLERELFPVPSREDLWNPYRDRSDGLDRADAVAVRRANLRNYLAAYAERPPVFLLAEAPGPWGCRFSGVPLTSEAQLVDPAFPLDGAQSSLNETPYREYSAGIYWRVLGPYFPRFFTWNAVPLHPHRPGEPLTIRNPAHREVAAFGGLLAGLLDLLRPERILAVGRKAEYALAKVGAEAIYVRHPSQGGARKFEEGVRAVFSEMGLAEGG